MSPQFSIAHLTLLSLSPPDLVEVAAAAGYDLVGFRAIPVGTKDEPHHPLTRDRTLLTRTRRALANTGLKALDVELARIVPGLDPHAYLAAMEVAAELGAKHILSSGWSEDRNFVLDTFITLCDLARPFGLTVEFEFVSFASVATLAAAADLIRSAGCDNAGLMIDTLHFDRSGTRLEELDALPHQWLRFAQICNAPPCTVPTPAGMMQTAREGRSLLHEGCIDVAAILARLPRMPYSIEAPNKSLLAELGAAEFARRNLESAKSYLATVHPVTKGED